MLFMKGRISKIKMTSKAWTIIVIALIGLNGFQFCFFMLTRPVIDTENTPMDATSVMGANAANYIGKTVTVDGFIAQGGSNESWLVASMDDAQRNGVNKSHLLEITGPVPADFLKNAGGRVRIKGVINWDTPWGVPELKYESHVVLTAPTTANIAFPISIRLNLTQAFTSLKYAVLISGGINSHEAYLRYWNDIVAVYSVLVNHYKFDPKNIYVFYKDGHGEDNSIPVNGSATKSIIQAGFDTLRPKLVSLSNLLFVYTTNHGNTTNGLILWGENDFVTDTDFKNFLSTSFDVPMVIVMEQCASGEFIKALSRTNRVIMTACNMVCDSYESPVDSSYDEFTFTFVSAINGTTPNGYPVSGVDRNGDGHISMFEAFYYADSWNTKEYPLYDDNGDGVGQHVPWAVGWTENGVGSTTYLDS